MNPAQKKPPSLDSDRMKIEYHGRHGVLHVTATFPLDQLESVVERVKAQRQCWADAGQGALTAGEMSRVGQPLRCSFSEQPQTDSN